MRSILYVLSALAVMALAFWAYRENYATQQQIKEVRALHSQIGAAHARLNTLEAEWAYLNRPDRLRDLADLNFERLGLLPIMPDAFGRVDQVIYPMPALLPITEAIEVKGSLEGEEPQ